jgi:hypothetical protein
MINTPDNLLYPLADALNIELREVNDRIRGFTATKLTAGPWRIDADLIVVSDVLTVDCASVFVKIVGNLWLYAVSRTGAPLIMYVIDNVKLGLHVKDITSFGGKSVDDTLYKLGKRVPGLVTAYEFDDNTKTWIEDASIVADIKSGPPSTGTARRPRNLDADPRTKNAVLALPGPKGLS